LIFKLALKFKLILRLIRLNILFFRSYDDSFDDVSFFGIPGDLAEICIQGCNSSLNPENDRIGEELHLSQEVY
jgi:hypothetical protein